jgi:hypothetical protein
VLKYLNPFGYFIFVILLSLVSKSDPAGIADNELSSLDTKKFPKDTQISSMQKTVSDVRDLVKYLPGNASRAFESYLEVARPNEYKYNRQLKNNNAGVNAYFSEVYSREENKCLYTKALLFYSYIQGQENKKSREEGPLNGRPDISSRTEPGTEIHPGWVWKKAMELSNGDPHQAMMLIGVCGHDDYGSSREPSFAELKNDSYHTDELLKQTDIKWSAAELRFNTGKNSGLYNFNCPKASSVFYTPGSLSKSADISEDLKKKIVQIQAPTKGAKVIPAKYYHVYNGAFMACKMIQDGVSKSAAVEYPAKFVSVYRRTRLCAESEKLKKNADEINNLYQTALRQALSTGRSSFSITDYVNTVLNNDSKHQSTLSELCLSL